jgi:hypothetical protein
VNNTTLSVYIPASDSGPGDSTSIRVTSPGGTSPNTPADQFTYNPPASVALSPTKGLPGIAVKVSGAHFASGENVTVVYVTGLTAPRPTQVAMCTATTTASGAFACKGKIPVKGAGAKGVHFIVASGTVGDSSSANFDLT